MTQKLFGSNIKEAGKARVVFTPETSLNQAV